MTAQKSVAAGDGGDGKSEKGKAKEVKADPEKGKSKDKDDKSTKAWDENASPTASQQALQEAEVRAQMRRTNLCKKPQPLVTKVPIHTRPWRPPPPPQRPPKVVIQLPQLDVRHWVPPYRRRRRPRPKLPRSRPEELTLPYETTTKKAWHKFTFVDNNKMMLQGSLSCNNRKYIGDLQGAQTGCIAVIARALLHDKTPAQLIPQDIDDVIRASDSFYKQCIKHMKCYKGKPALTLKQLLPEFYFGYYKWSYLLNQEETGVLAKHPDNTQAGPDLMTMMEKKSGSQYMYILTVGNDKHFLIWGHPPDGGGPNVKTICYIFEPHMVDEYGHQIQTERGCCGAPYRDAPEYARKRYGGMNGGAVLRYPGIASFVMDFLGAYCDLSAAKRLHPKPPVTLTSVEIASKEPILRYPGFALDAKLRKAHCPAEQEALNMCALLDKKIRRGQYALGSLSFENIKATRSNTKSKMQDFYQRIPKEPPPPVPPVPPEKPPPPITNADLLNQYKGEDFFLMCPRPDGHSFGRDDLIPLKESEQQVFSPFDIAMKNFKSQFNALPGAGGDVWILRGTRHFASMRYTKFKWYTGVACSVAALAMLRKVRARGWNEDQIDETLDVGWNLFRDSLGVRRGPVRRLVLGELKDTFKMRDKDFKHTERSVAVWGKLYSKNSKVYDLCRAVQLFFREADTGILQIPGEFETAIWYEGGRYYLYHPWPADRFGNRVSLQGGGKACLLMFAQQCKLVEHFLANTKDLKRKPFTLSDVGVWDLGVRPEPFNHMKTVGKDRWLVRGSYHEGDERFKEEHRNRQATPIAIAAVAFSKLVDPAEWTPQDIDEILNRGDVLYENTMDTLDKLGINLELPAKGGEEAEDEEVEVGPVVTGALAAADVLTRFNISEYDNVETDIQDSLYSGLLNPEPGSPLMNLKDSLSKLFKEYDAAVVTARGSSYAVFNKNGFYYFFDPHGCDDNGLPAMDTTSAACLVRMRQSVKELADTIMGNLPPGSDDSFNISPVDIIPAKINPETGAPEIQKETRAHEWLSRQRATILMGPRGETTAMGKAATKALVGENLSGDLLAQFAVGAFVAATAVTPAPGMHQEHIFNFLDMAADFALAHQETSGRSWKEANINETGMKVELGANTIEVTCNPDPAVLPLRLPDMPAEGGGGEEEEPGAMFGEGGNKEPPLKEVKELLYKYWYDTTEPYRVLVMKGDYHTLGVWLQPGGKVVAFDPAPTLVKGVLTPQRIAEGDEKRVMRLKMAKSGEEGEDEEEPPAGEEQQPEPEPQFVPPEACAVLMEFSSPGEFIDKLVSAAPLNNQQMIAPYTVYLCETKNELTHLLKEKKPETKMEEGAEAADAEEEDALVEPLADEAMGTHYSRQSRTVGSLRGTCAQNEQYFLNDPNRDNQDAANAVMGIAVHHIEPYQHWKPSLIDCILKYGDRLYTLSLPNAKNKPRVCPEETVKEFRVRNFTVKTEIEGDVVTGDYKALDSGKLLNMRRGIQKAFAEGAEYIVVCCKNYCFGVWKGADEKSWVYWDPHPVGPKGRLSPASFAGVVLYSTLNELAETVCTNIDNLCRPGPNKYTIASVKVSWDFTPVEPAVTVGGDVADEPYDLKVLTAFVECGRGHTILRGSPPTDLPRFARDALIASAPTAIVGACMSLLRRPPLWTYRTVDAVMCQGCKLFNEAISKLGYEFRPNEDVLHPLQVPKKFVLGVNFIRYDLQELCTGKVEQKEAGAGMNAKAALESFFGGHSVGLLWAAPHAVAVWRAPGAPNYYMFDPHACTQRGRRIDPETETEGAACVQTFSSPKLLAHTYLKNIPPYARYKRHFTMYVLSMTASPVTPLVRDPPLVRAQRGLPPHTTVVPATSRVDMYGRPRRADESRRQHPPGDTTYMDILRDQQERDKNDDRYKGVRNSNGWLVLVDGTAYMSASHSIACKRFPYASRGNQSLACSVMAVAMSGVEEVCRWCNTTLDQILDSGGLLYQDSYLHYRPEGTPILSIEQILRTFYTPGNCMCRVSIFKARQQGKLTELYDKLKEFFREERKGVFVAYGGEFAVALFKTPRGYYMFDPADRDRYGRAVDPALIGRARACLSQYPYVADLAEKLGANIGPPTKPPPDIPDLPGNTEGVSGAPSAASTAARDTKPSQSQVRFADTKRAWPEFAIYGMSVSSMRRLNEK